MKNKIQYILNNVYLTAFSALIILLFLGLIDWKTGYELSFQFFYFLPLTIVAYNIKLNKGFLIVFSITTSIVWFLADYYANHILSNELFYFWNTISRFIVFCLFTLFLNSIVKHKKNIDLLNNELYKKSLILTESINYAKTIQSSIIPDFQDLKNIFPNSYIFSKPRDIISGDFFWYHKKNDFVFLALADCTGHGVPASLLTIVGNDLLNKIIIDKNIVLPNEILKNLHNDLVSIFSTGSEKIDDGMEISLIRFDVSKNEIILSQSSQGAIIVEPNGDIKEFACHGYTIGGMLAKRLKGEYTSQKIKVEKGSWVYLFSDGYIDQFGSDENIKFGINNFTSLLKKVHNLSSNYQLNEFSNSFENWKGKYAQVDDILVFGIEL